MIIKTALILLTVTEQLQSVTAVVPDERAPPPQAQEVELQLRLVKILNLKFLVPSPRKSISPEMGGCTRKDRRLCTPKDCTVRITFRVVVVD